MFNIISTETIQTITGYVKGFQSQSKKKPENTEKDPEIAEESKPIRALVDEIAWTNIDTDDSNNATDDENIMSEIEFNKFDEKILSINLPDQEIYKNEKTLWTTRRRFRVKLHGLILQNLTSQKYTNIFLVIYFGGVQIEVQVRDQNDGKTYPQIAGFSSHQFTTGSTQILPNESINIFFHETFEWRGSYLHLEKEYLTIEVWNHKTGLNKLLSRQKELLRNFVDSSTAQSMNLDYYNSKTYGNFMKLNFHLEFQEIYLHEINLCNVTIKAVSDSSNEDGESEKLLKSKKVFRGPYRVHFTNKTALNQNPVLTVYSLNIKKIIDFHQNLGTFIFKGTFHDLARAVIDIDFRRPQSFSAGIKGSLILKDINQTNTFTCDLYHKNKVIATMQGDIGIPHQSKFKQKDQIIEIDDQHAYLFVKILNADKLPAVVDFTETYVDVQYAGVVKQTSRVLTHISPHYQSELIFQICDLSSQNLTPEKIDSNGPIIIDLWCNTKEGRLHIGWTKFHIYNIYDSETSKLQTKFYTKNQRNKASYECRVLTTSCKLRPLLHGANTFIHFEAWTKPDLSNINFLKHVESTGPEIPKNIRPKVEECLKLWNGATSSRSVKSRKFHCLAIDPKDQILPLNMYVTSLPPISLTWNLLDYFFFVTSIPFVKLLQQRTNYLAASPFDYFLLDHRGSVLMHNMLFVSYALSLHIEAYVCLGTNVSEVFYTCVLTRENGEIVFWDLKQAKRYHFNKFDTHSKMSDSVSMMSMPPKNMTRKLLTDVYNSSECLIKTIDVVFNDRQIYANIHSSSLDSTIFQLNEQKYWHQFYQTPANNCVYNFSPSLNLSTPSISATLTTTKNLYNQITEAIQELRHQMSKSALTRWISHFSFLKFLNSGVIIKGNYERKRLPENDQSYEDWKSGLKFSLPPKYFARWMFITCNYTNAMKIAQLIWDTVPFIKDVDISIAFALGININAYPGDLSQVDMIVLAVSQSQKGDFEH